jgi:hypothetical protein
LCTAQKQAPGVPLREHCAPVVLQMAEQRRMDFFLLVFSLEESLERTSS